MDSEASMRSFSDLVKKSIQSEIERILTEETEAAVKQVEQNVRRRVKEMTVQVAATILQRFDMCQRDSVLTIRVNFEEDKK